MKLKNISKRSLILILAIYCALSVMLVIGVSASDGGTGETPTLEVAANNVSYADSVYILYAIKTEGFQTNKNEVKMLFWYDVEETYEL